MRSTAVGRGLVGAVFLAVLVACSSDPQSSAEPSATVPTAPATTTTTDPYAVPAVIDAAYVNRVLAGLDAAFGDIVRELASARRLPDNTPDRLKGVYGDLELFNLQFGVLQRMSRPMWDFRDGPTA